jgi:catechol 2,3-dioxygenase-like lactoylglutathione lyase family enzyme
MTRNLVVAVVFFLGGYLVQQANSSKADDQAISLGNFSVSLVVKDIARSREFYEKLGFHVKSGDKKRWVVMQNDTASIGLFQGFFDKNSLTFNPGWDRTGKALPTFQDVREIQKTLKSRGLKLDKTADESTTGTAYFALTDPDGNPVLVDQHVPAPQK